MSDISIAIESALDTLALEAQRDFSQTMQTWQTHKSPVRIEKSTYRRVVYVNDEIYGYLNYGTRVRRALLSSDWKSKTSPGVIPSGLGAGYVVAISRKFDLPGIKARKWDEAIVERIEMDVLPKVLTQLSERLVAITVKVLGK